MTSISGVHYFRGKPILLVSLGLAALIDGADHWRSAFVYRHQNGDWMDLALLAVYGHLVADCIWMVAGTLWFGMRIRRDLLIHHGLGLIAFGFALYLHVGYAIALIAMTTEVLPVTTGLGALGKHLNLSSLVDVAERLHFHVLAWFRVPLWSLLLLLTIDVLLDNRADDLYLAFVVVASGLVLLIMLDLYWIRECRQRKVTI
jgi:hypothetical protein